MAIEKIGPYQLGEQLGKGGMGTVYRAVDEKTNAVVAIKLLSEAHSHSQHLRQRFESEIETLIKLDHPNIVRLLSYGQEQSQLYFTMELVEGNSLHEIQKQGHHFHWKEVTDITLDICAGLRHAHDRGVVHRDLKPGNLLMTRDHSVKVTDFGIAKLFGGTQITAAGGVVGTADYMAPEQAKGDPINIRTEMYGLGAVIYALLARRPPFSSQSVHDAIHKLTTQKPESVRVYAPDVPAELEAIIDRLLEKDPAKRIGTTQALANRLKDFLENQSLKAEAETDSSMVADPNFDESSKIDQTIPSSAPSPPPGTELTQDSSDPGSEQHTFKDRPVTSMPKASANTLNQGGTSSTQPTEIDYFTEISNQQREHIHSGTNQTESKQAVWPFAIGFAALLSLIGFGLYQTYSNVDTADEVYAAIESADQEGDIDSAKQEMAEFVERFADDDRIEFVIERQQLLEAVKLPRRLEQKARLRGLMALTPIERDFLTTSQMAMADPQRASRKFRALVDLYQVLELSHQDQIVLKAAEVKAKEAASRYDAKIESLRQLVEEAFSKAAELRNDSPKKSKAVLHGIIVLYSDQTWAEDLVEKARQELADQ